MFWLCFSWNESIWCVLTFPCDQMDSQCESKGDPDWGFTGSLQRVVYKCQHKMLTHLKTPSLLWRLSQKKKKKKRARIPGAQKANKKLSYSFMFISLLPNLDQSLQTRSISPQKYTWIKILNLSFLPRQSPLTWQHVPKLLLASEVMLGLVQVPGGPSFCPQVSRQVLPDLTGAGIEASSVRRLIASVPAHCRTVQCDHPLWLPV